MIKLHLLFVDAISAVELGTSQNNIVLSVVISFSFHFQLLNFEFLYLFLSIVIWSSFSAASFSFVRPVSFVSLGKIFLTSQQVLLEAKNDIRPTI
jgi:hypothetical protein